MNKDLCKGCQDNIYNLAGKPGHSNGCWNLEDAKVVKRRKVPLDKKPPWDDCEVVKVPNCYHDPNHVYVDPEKTR